MGRTCKWISLISTVLLFHFLFPMHVNAEENHSKVLVIYSSASGEIDEHQRLLDMLISHFTTDIVFVNSKKVKKKDLEHATHVFYYGQVKEELPSTFQQLLSSYKGSIVAIGHNIEQLHETFPFVKINEEVVTDRLLLTKENKEITVDPHTILQLETLEGADVLIQAKQGEHSYPLFIQLGKKYYYATNNLFPPLSNFLAEVLHDVFMVKHETPTQAFLRLEDIHPASEPEQLMAIAKLLEQRNIPYMASVVPVYIDPETEEEYHLADAPKVRAALKYMQEHGGSIILHGYTDQYHNTKTGEGFEFWDLEKNMPIYVEPGKSIDGNNREDLKKYEASYILERLQKGVRELVEYGLYPLAFEAPHYVMSQNGYKVISEHFSTYVGQVQLSDEDWRIMTESPYISNPTYLHGMKLLPETIRYVRYEDPASIQEMKMRMNDFTAVRDGVIGGFYHPFLGVNGLLQMLGELEKYPDLKWIDLKEMQNSVEFDGISIASKDGELKVEIEKESNDVSESGKRPITYLLNLWKENAVWISAGAVATLCMIVLSYIMLRRGRGAKV